MKEREFNFDIKRMKDSLASGVISFPSGLTGEQRRAWLRAKLENMKQVQK